MTVIATRTGINNFARAAHFFRTFFWPQLHDHKRPSFTFYGGREVKKTTFFLFFELKRSSLHIERDGIRAIIIFKQREFILYVTFLLRSPAPYYFGFSIQYALNIRWLV